ncbi:AAA family ATPase [Microbacterium sp. NPDC003461]|jgi:MinD-like ATPase involved in chromosome partitioning or flagellar assembly
MRVVVALEEPHGARIAAELRRGGHEALGVPVALVAREAADEHSRLHEALAGSDLLAVALDRAALTPDLVRACDRHAVRIVALAGRGADARLARAFGLAEPLPIESRGDAIVAAARGGIGHGASGTGGTVTAVWGPHGAPGRTALAIELAVALGTRDRRAALVDADTHAPAIAVALGLPEESPGVAAACRRAAEGIDPPELSRISVPIGGTAAHVDVLTGLNRPSRWPELSGARLGAVLDACRGWSAHTVVDVAAALERDEEIVSDLEGPRRNAATLTALERADRIVAVASADPVGIGRFIRAHAELRALVGPTPVHVVVNRLRTGALGVDARGQVRRTLERFAGLGEVSFVPHDGRAADAALLAARPVGEVAPRSSLAQAVRRVAERIEAPTAAARHAPDEARPGRRALRRRAA